MLNSVALNAILDVDEFLFEGMTPIKIQHAIRSVEPISVSYSHRRSQVESMVHFLAVLATVLASYLFLLVPLCETMMTVKRELCDGQINFVVAYNTETQVSWGMDRGPCLFTRSCLKGSIHRGLDSAASFAPSRSVFTRTLLRYELLMSFRPSNEP